MESQDCKHQCPEELEHNSDEAEALGQQLSDAKGGTLEESRSPDVSEWDIISSYSGSEQVVRAQLQKQGGSMLAKERAEAKVALCRARLEQAIREAELTARSSQLQEVEAEIIKEEEALREKRESLLSLHEQLRVLLRKREKAGEEFTEEWTFTLNRLGGEAADPRACLQAVQDDPEKPRSGLLGQYAVWHREVLDVQLKQQHAAQSIVALEAALQQRRGKLHDMPDQKQATQDPSQGSTDAEVTQLPEKTVKPSMADPYIEQRAEPAESPLRRPEAEQHKPAFVKVVVGMFVLVLILLLLGTGLNLHAMFMGGMAKGTQLAAFSQSMEIKFDKRLKEHTKLVLKAASADSLCRLLADGDLTVNASMEDFGYSERQVVECARKLVIDKAENAKVLFWGLIENGVGIASLRDAGVQLQQLIANGVTVDMLFSLGCSHLEVAQALCKAVPQPPASSDGASVTYIFAGPQIQQYRREGKFSSLVSEELRWEGIADPKFRYSFKLVLYPNSDTENKGAVGLFWHLMYGPHGERRAWPMPHERCIMRCRMLCGRHAPDTCRHEELTMDGRSDEGFRSHLASKMPQQGKMPEGGYGWAKALTVEQATSGGYHLGAAEDAVAVQCNLRLV
mmetsp:Transcript_11046/g.20045  ORF Transcript_11046/g.20045 Transcript_11046/m.20045 type:complete len:623 (-) Transcript_11046:28-1896(-)